MARDPRELFLGFSKKMLVGTDIEGNPIYEEPNPVDVVQQTDQKEKIRLFRESIKDKI